MENFNIQRNKRMLLRVGDLNLKYKDEIINDPTLTNVEYKANIVHVKDVNVNMKIDNNVIDMDNQTVNIDGQTPGGETEGYLVRFIDFNGDILKSEYVLTGQSATPPTEPTHDLLTFNSWNITYDNIENNTDVGATYDTVDNKTYINLTLTKQSGYQPTLYLNKLSGTTLIVDWGDEISTINDDSTTITLQKPTSYSSGTTGLINQTINITADGEYGIGDGNESILYNQDAIIFNYIYLGSNIVNINNNAFDSCSSLTSISIPNSVSSIGNNAFQYCTSLTSISIPNSVSSIGYSAFDSCYSLTSISIPDLVSSIGNNAFNNCSSLTSISIPDSVSSIGYSAFNSCYSLTSISIGDSVSGIGDSAFNSCSSLTSVSIPDSVSSIGNDAFNSCTSLTSISIPDSVSSIGNYAFNNCTSLTSIILEPLTPPTLTASIFSSLSIIIYVPDSSLEDYKAASIWSDYANQIYPISAMI